MLWVQAFFSLFLSEGRHAPVVVVLITGPGGDPFLMPVATRGEAISCLRE